MSIAQNYPIVSPALSLDFANVQALDPRISYARATTATYYGTRTALAEQNLLLQSQNFATTWDVYNATRTVGVTDPAGGTTAATITKTANDSFSLRQNASLNTRNATVTLSFFLKGSGTVTFRSDNFVDQALTQQITLSATWTRYTWTFTFNGTGSITTGAFGIGMTAGDTATSFDVAFAQLEQRSTVTAYTPTTTQPVTNYIPVLETAASGVARFDHNPVTFESLGLLIEEQRTNLLLQSDDFANASWSKTNTTVTSNTIVAPDGTLTGDALVVTSAGVQCTIAQAAILAAVASTFTCYIKAGSASWVCLGSNQFAADFGWFNVSTGVVGSRSGAVTASQIQAVGNGWYRCSVTGTFTANSNRTISVASADTVFTSPSVGSEVYIWGAQLEAGAFATSYIPTVASQVTRAADAASMTGTNFSSWYTQGEGTLYVESLAQNTAAANNKNLRFSDGTTSNEIWLGSGSPGTSARSQITLGGVNYFDSNMSNQVTAGQFGKYALAFETNNTVLCSNGTLGTVDTAVAIASSINQFAIIPPSQRAGYYKKIAYYPVAVTSAQLQALTS